MARDNIVGESISKAGLEPLRGERCRAQPNYSALNQSRLREAALQTVSEIFGCRRVVQLCGVGYAPVTEAVVVPMGLESELPAVRFLVPEPEPPIP